MAMVRLASYPDAQRLHQTQTTGDISRGIELFSHINFSLKLKSNMLFSADTLDVSTLSLYFHDAKQKQKHTLGGHFLMLHPFIPLVTCFHVFFFFFTSWSLVKV